MRVAGALLLAAWLAMPLPAQQFKFNLENLEKKAADSVDVNLSGSLLQLAAKFMDGNDPDEAQAKKLIAGISGIYVKSLTFKNEGVWSKADLDGVRNQLREPDWTRIVGVKSAEEGETVDVYVRNENKKITGVAVIAAEPTELTIVNIVGPVDLDALADLSGHFNIPKIEKSQPKPKKQD